jgi:hypothetical protein
VASTQRTAAKVSFGMPDFVVEGLAGLRLWDLQRIAMDCTALMKPRWPANSGFWPDLVRFAARGDAERLNATQLLGSQLIAAELRLHSGPRSILRTAMTQPPPGGDDLFPIP